MEKTLRVLNRMVKDGVIEQYAIGGAVAAIFYVEPINTNDVDVFFHVKDPSAGLDILAPLYEYLSGLGYRGHKETLTSKAGRSSSSYIQSSIGRSSRAGEGHYF